MWTANSVEIFLMLGKIERRRRRWWSEDEMAGWHQWCDGHELGQTLGDGEEQRGLACCRPLCLKESDSTGWLKNNNTPLVPALMPGTPLSQALCICCSWATLRLGIGLAKNFIQIFPSAGMENLNEFLASLISIGVISYLRIFLRCHLLSATFFPTSYLNCIYQCNYFHPLYHHSLSFFFLQSPYCCFMCLFTCYLYPPTSLQVRIFTCLFTVLPPAIDEYICWVDYGISNKWVNEWMMAALHLEMSFNSAP